MKYSLLRIYIFSFVFFNCLFFTAVAKNDENKTDKVYNLEEVVISEGVSKDTAQEVSNILFSKDDLKMVPQHFFGDLSTSLKSLPGVIKTSKFSAELYVRGGKPYEMLHLLNGIPVFNPYKWGGAMLAYNPDLVDEVSLHAGGFGAKYPEAMSGVLDVRYAEGNLEKIKGEVTLGAETNILIDGPLYKGSFLMSYRRSFYDLFITDTTKKGDKMSYPFFQDVYFDLSQQLTEKDKIRFWMMASDEGMNIVLNELDDDNENEFSDDEDIKYDDLSLFFTLEYEHNFSKDSYLNLIYSNYQNETKDFDINTYFAEFRGEAKTTNHTCMLEYYKNFKNHHIKTGFFQVAHEIKKYNFRGDVYILNNDESSFVEKRISNTLDELKEEGLEESKISIGYLEDKIHIGKLIVTPGLNISYSDMMKNNNTIYDPRIRFAYEVNKDSVLSLAIGKYSMHVHDLNITKNNPEIEPEESKHYVIGYDKKINDTYKLRVETYYKNYKKLTVSDPLNQNELNDGEYDFIYDNRGIAKAYGLEFYLQKKRTKTSKFDGWISYSYAKTRRKEFALDRPDWFTPLYDLRHTLNIVSYMYFFRTKRRELFLNTSIDYSKGRKFEDFDIVKLPLKDNTVYVKEENDTYKELPDYFSLDLTLEYVEKFRKFNMHSFLQVINATNHENVIDYYVGKFSGITKKETDLGLMVSGGIKLKY